MHLQEEGGIAAAGDSDAEDASPPREEAGAAPYNDDEFEEAMELEEEGDQDMVLALPPLPASRATC